MTVFNREDEHLEKWLKTKPKWAFDRSFHNQQFFRVNLVKVSMTLDGFNARCKTMTLGEAHKQGWRYYLPINYQRTCHGVPFYTSNGKCVYCKRWHSHTYNANTSLKAKNLSEWERRERLRIVCNLYHPMFKWRRSEPYLLRPKKKGKKITCQTYNTLFKEAVLTAHDKLDAGYSKISVVAWIINTYFYKKKWGNKEVKQIIRLVFHLNVECTDRYYKAGKRLLKIKKF